MKYIRLTAYQIALVFRNDAFLRVLEAGGNWVRIGDEVICYDLSKPFVPPCELNLLLKDKRMPSLMDVVTVKDEEVVIVKENGLFHSLLTVGRYAFLKGVIERTFEVYNTNELYVPSGISSSLLNKAPIANHLRMVVVENHERGLLFVDGKFENELEPGTYYFWKNNRTINVLKADLRQLQLEVSGQEILTSDKANLRISLVAHYQITDERKALLQNKDYDKQLYVLLQMAYRQYVSHMSFDELLDKKDMVADDVKKAIAAKCEELGVNLTYTGIKDIILPGEVKDIMNMVLVAEKKAQANIITRREETASTRSLLNTAKLMEDNQMLFRLKEMEYVEKIAEKINHLSVTGDNRVLDQLRQIFSTAK